MYTVQNKKTGESLKEWDSLEAAKRHAVQLNAWNLPAIVIDSATNMVVYDVSRD